MLAHRRKRFSHSSLPLVADALTVTQHNLSPAPTAGVVRTKTPSKKTVMSSAEKSTASVASPVDPRAPRPPNVKTGLSASASGESGTPLRSAIDSMGKSLSNIFFEGGCVAKQGLTSDDETMYEDEKEVNLPRTNTPWGFWGQPLASTYKIRSKNYLKTKKKIPSRPLLTRVLAVEAFKGPKPVQHVCSYPFSWYQKNKRKLPKGGFTFVHSVQMTSMGTTVFSYHHIPDSTKLPKLVQQFIDGDDKFRNNRFKMIPRIVDGPWIVRSSVRSETPVLVGRKLNLKWYRGDGYLEVNMNCDTNFMSSWIIGLAKPMAKQVVCELSWTIEGRSEDELPERMFAGCLYNVNFGKFRKVVWKDGQPVELLPFPGQSEELLSPAKAESPKRRATLPPTSPGSPPKKPRQGKTKPEQVAARGTQA